MKRSIAVFFILALCWSNNAWSQVFIEQGKVKLNISPGESINGTLMVHNTSGDTVKVKAYWEDFTYEPPYDGTKKFLPPGSTPRSCGKWIKFLPQEFVFPPFGKQKIDYVINPPQDAEGGYYGVLFFEKDETKSTAQRGLNIVSRVGSLFFLESQDRNKKAMIEDFKVEGGLIKGQFQNNGDVVLIPSGTFYVMNKEGLAVDRGEIKKYYLPPGEKAGVEVKLNPSVSPGDYTIVLTFDLEDGDSFVKEVDLKKDPSNHLQITATRD